MSQMPIEFKGSNFTLSVLHIQDGAPEAIRQAIQEKIKQLPLFLKYAPIVLNVSFLSEDIDWCQIYQVIADTGIHVVGVSGCHNSKLKQQIINHGLPILNEVKSFKQTISRPSSHAPVLLSKYNKTRIISSHVRSGQLIYARNCDLIVTNTVSSGAELIADGNIHVYGIMLGRALAGASSDCECQIFCTNFSPELVSIAGQYWLNNQIPTEYLGKAARLSLQNSRLMIQSLM